MLCQATLRRRVSFEGVGLHTGSPAAVTLHPAAADHGIIFHRRDLSPPVAIPATADHVVDSQCSTTLGAGGGAVASVEHLMAAFFACGIDNAVVAVQGPEVPIMDGSAFPFIRGIREAGVRLLPKRKGVIRVTESIEVSDGEKRLRLLPASYLKIAYQMDFQHRAVPNQRREYDSRQEDFIDAYASARTFGFLEEVKCLQAQGMARGGSLDNAVLIGSRGIVNGEGLRFEDEFIRHKILDLAGDLYLAGCPVIGHISGWKSGHALNHRLAKEVRRAGNLVPPPDSHLLFTSRGKIDY